MSRKIFIGILFGLLMLFGTASESLAQKTKKTPPPKGDPNGNWQLVLGKAMDYTEENPEVIVILINRAKNGNDASLAKLEKEVVSVINELKLGVSFKIFAGTSETKNTYYSLFALNNLEDNYYETTEEDFQKKAKELAAKIKSMYP
jgi:hypothetical protein